MLLGKIELLSEELHHSLCERLVVLEGERHFGEVLVSYGNESLLKVLKPPREAFQRSDSEFEFREPRLLICQMVIDYLSEDSVLAISSLMIHFARVPK